MKTKDTIKIHVTLTQAALAKVDKQEMLDAKFDFTRRERLEPVNLIEPVRKVEPLRFSLASLLPAGV